MAETNSVAWVVISEVADLYSFLAAAQVDAINSAAKKAGQSNRFADIMRDTINSIRLKIGGNHTNLVSLTPLSIPPELRWVAAWLIIELLQASIPTLAFDEDQRALIREAHRTLQRVEDGKAVVSRPTDPQTVPSFQTAAPAVVVTKSCKLATRETLKGL